MQHMRKQMQAVFKNSILNLFCYMMSVNSVGNADYIQQSLKTPGALIWCTDCIMEITVAVLDIIQFNTLHVLVCSRKYKKQPRYDLDYRININFVSMNIMYVVILSYSFTLRENDTDTSIVKRGYIFLL